MINVKPMMLPTITYLDHANSTNQNKSLTTPSKGQVTNLKHEILRKGGIPYEVCCVDN